jgi:hypothetical protein
MKYAIKISFLAWIAMLTCCNPDRPDGPEVIASSIMDADNKTASAQQPFAQAYPDDETLDVLLQGSSGEKSKRKNKELDYLWGFVTGRRKYRKDDGSYDYERMNADLWQTSFSKSIPVVKGDKQWLKKYFKRKLGPRYDDYQTTKVCHEADSVWSIYISGKFNRQRTSWASSPDSPFTQGLGYSSNK